MRAASSHRTATSPTCKRDSATGAYPGFGQCCLCGSFVDPQVEQGDNCRNRGVAQWARQSSEFAPDVHRSHTGFGECRLCGAFLDAQLEHDETCSSTEATWEHCACVYAVLGELRLVDPGITTEPGGLTEAQSRPADPFTAAVVTGRSADLDVCVASSNAVAARGDAAQAAFDRKIFHYRRENSRPPGSRHRLSPCGLDSGGRPHAAVTRTPQQHAADIAACRNLQQRSTRNSNSPSPSAGSPSSYIGKGRMAFCQPHRQGCTALDGGDDDEDAGGRILHQSTDCSHPNLKLVTVARASFRGLSVL